MRKRKASSTHGYASERPIAWLPIDSRLFMPFVGFGRVKGISRIFLEIELALSILVVLGTMVLLVLSFFS